MTYKRFDVERPGDVGLTFYDDVLPFDLPPNSWTFAYNVRFTDGGVEAARGWLKRIQLPQICNHLFYNTGIDGNYWLALGSTKIYSVANSYTITDVTRSTGAYTSEDWMHHNFQGLPIATNNTDLPQIQFETGKAPSEDTLFQDHPIDADSLDRCALFIGYKNFLVALNITEDGDNFPTKVRWSHPAAPGDLPDNWGVDVATSLSGEVVLPADTGPIVCAELLRDDLIIYMTDAIYRMSYVGGSSVMSFRRISNNFGAFGKSSVQATRGGNHILLTRDDLGWFDGNSFSSVAKGRAKHTLQLILTSAKSGQARIAFNSAFNEIWFALVFPPSAANFKLINVIQIDSGAISQRMAPYLRDLYEMPDRDVSSKYAVAALTWDNMSNLPLLDGWNKVGDATWDTSAHDGSIDDYFVMGLGEDGDIYRMDYGMEFSHFDEYESRLEKTDLNITGDENTCVVVACYPRFSTLQIPQVPPVETWDDIGIKGTYWDGSDGGDPDYSTYAWDEFFDGRRPPLWYIGSQSAAGAVVNWKSPKLLGSRYKVATKVRGRRHAIKIVSQGHPWRLSGYMLEYTDSGRKS